MEDNSSFDGSLVIAWLEQELANTPPASTDDIAGECPDDRFLDIESESALRILALGRKLSREPEYGYKGILTDPKMREALKQVAEKLLLAERRMALGAKGRGVDRFKLYRGGKLGERIKSK